MKILCVIDSLGSGGAQRQLVGLAKGFKAKGHSVSFLVYYNEVFFKKELDEAGIPIYVILEANYLKRLIKMRRYIRSGNYDAVLSFLEAANFICEIAGLPKRRWRLVVGERSANPNMLKSYKQKFYRWFHLLADYVVANSHENIKMVRQINPFLSSKKCLVIYNIIDFEKWNVSLEYIPYKEGRLKIIVAASHQYLKNLIGLVEAIHLLSEKEKSQLNIEWYGDTQDASKDEALLKIKTYQLTNFFSFFEATHDIVQKMQQADFIGLFSFYEGLPNALCEGMACGKPVIGPLVSEIPFLLASDHKLLFDPTNVQSICSTIKYVLSLKKEILIEIGKQNRATAQLYFNQESIINEYLTLMK